MTTPIDQPNLLYLIYANITAFTEIGQVNEYPLMHYFGNSRHTQSMLAHKILSISGNSSERSWVLGVTH